VVIGVQQYNAKYSPTLHLLTSFNMREKSLHVITKKEKENTGRA
jgi:hypothetical protein